MNKLLRLSTMALVVGSVAHAQTDENTDDQSVFELSPFVVNTANDRGYTATSSMAGGRLSTDLRDTAAAVSVMTEDFLQDIGATNFLEAAKWAPNAVPNEEINQSGDRLFNDYGVNFRSLGAGFQSRNYFRWYINSDSYNIERIEFARGPNSLVFGDAGVGGVANVSSKRALSADRYELSAQWSSFGGYRVTADANIKISDKLAVRASVLHQDLDDWRDVGGNQRDGVFVTATLQPFENTTVRAEFEWGQQRRVYSFGLLEAFTFWDGETTVAGPISGGAPGGLSRINADRLVWNSAQPQQGLTNWLGFGQTNGTYRQMLTTPQQGLGDVVISSYKLSFQADNAGVTNPYWTSSLFVEQQIGQNLFFELAANLQYQERDVWRWFFDGVQIDVNEVRPDGSPNPYFMSQYGDSRFRNEVQSNDVFDIRGSLAYLLETDLTEQRFLLVAGHRTDDFERDGYELVRSNGSDPRITAATNYIWIRRYAGETGTDVSQPPAIDPTSGIETRIAKTNSNASSKPITYIQAAVNGRWFSSRKLTTIAGVRHDIYKEKINDRSADVLDPVTNELLARGPMVQSDRKEVTSMVFSSVYHLTSNLSFFAGYSESFDPGSTAVALNGGTLPPLVSEGLEGGIKFNLFGNRVIGTLTYYKNEQENNRIGGQANSINNIWRFLDLQENNVDTYSDKQTFEGTGWEFELTASPTPNWRIMLNFALPETQLIEGYLDTKAYYEANNDFWRSAAAELAASDPIAANAVNTNADNIKRVIDGFDAGRSLNNTFKYTANVFTRYFFTDGAFKGFSIGGGVNFRGKRLVANNPGDAFDYIFSESYELISLVAGYERPMRGGTLSVQLNVSNLLDDQHVRANSYATNRIAGGTLADRVFAPATFAIQDPRKVTITVSYAF